MCQNYQMVFNFLYKWIISLTNSYAFLLIFHPNSLFFPSTISFQMAMKYDLVFADTKKHKNCTILVRVLRMWRVPDAHTKTYHFPLKWC